LINIGPTKEGRIAPIFEERLRQLGQWLSINGEAIYETRPWIYQNDTVNSDVWYTLKSGVVYGILLKWPTKSIIIDAPHTTSNTKVTMLGYNSNIIWKPINPDQSGIIIDIAQFVANALPSEWAWTFKLTNLNF
jgi:alpha-L-fucosidase